MHLLATSSPAWTVYLTPNGINNLDDAAEAEEVRKTIAEGLSTILEMEYDDLYELTKKKSYYVIVKKKIEKTTVDKIREFIVENEKLKMANYIGLDETTKLFN